MLIINPASAAGAAYWQRSAVHSRWLGQGAALLGLAGEVDTASLRSVMLGQSLQGEPLTERPGLRRRHGWDLIFAAPKSVSLLADAGSGPAAELRDAYRLAVGDALAVVEGRAAWLRSGGEQVPAQGVVGAAFEHLANDAGHPHLHTHLVLANLGTRGDGRWGCLVSSELWRWREGVGAGFHLALRSRLAEAGFGFSWAISEGGLGEIVSVPIEARSAASSRSRALRATARSFGSGSAATERAAQATTRQSSGRQSSGHQSSGRQNSRRPGPASVGWGPAEAARVLGRAMGEPALPSPPPAMPAVAGALVARGSTFGEPDVLVALAETMPSGLNLDRAGEWARNWCAASRPLPEERNSLARPGAQRRWTTSLADQVDQKVVDLATEARFAHLPAVMPALADGELAALGTPAGVASYAIRLACGGEGVALLPRAPWLAQAACIDAARAAWQAAGMTVRLACPSELSARRWRALTALQTGVSAGTGYEAASGRSGQRVLVVDAADHLSPKSLVSLLDRAASSRTKVVLVLGGSVPGKGPSVARSLDRLAEQQPAGPSPGPEPPLLQGPANGAISLPGIVVQGSLSGADAMAHTIEAWAGAVSRGDPPPLMVAFGPAEVEALNLAARPLWLELRATGAQVAGAQVAGAQVAGAQVAAGQMAAAQVAGAQVAGAQVAGAWVAGAMVAGARVAGEFPAAAEVVLGQRGYTVGDQVMALRRIGRATSATVGSVVGLEDGSLTVEWRGPSGPWRAEVGPEHARSLGYGYATTVPYLRSSDQAGQRLVVLGDPLELAGRAVRADAAWVTVPGPGLPAFGPNGWTARRQAGLRELATSWPDEEMLELAGPRPLGLAGGRRWAEVVVSCALRRELGLGPLDPGLGGVGLTGPAAPIPGRRDLGSEPSGYRPEVGGAGPVPRSAKATA